jgi:hypothetical protein
MNIIICEALYGIFFKCRKCYHFCGIIIFRVVSFMLSFDEHFSKSANVIIFMISFIVFIYPLFSENVEQSCFLLIDIILAISASKKFILLLSSWKKSLQQYRQIF